MSDKYSDEVLPVQRGARRHMVPTPWPRSTGPLSDDPSIIEDDTDTLPAATIEPNHYHYHHQDSTSAASPTTDTPTVVATNSLPPAPLIPPHAIPAVENGSDVQPALASRSSRTVARRFSRGTMTAANNYNHSSHSPTVAVWHSVPTSIWRYSWEKRFFLRAIELVSGIGAVGFLGGASSYSSYSEPFNENWFITVTLAVGVLTIVLLFFYLANALRILRSARLKLNQRGSLRVMEWQTSDHVVTLLDVLLCGLWLSGMIGLYTHHCLAGSLNGWCDFYNTSLFFGSATLLMQMIITAWEVHYALALLAGRPSTRRRRV